jgi:hypothetical protein
MPVLDGGLSHAPAEQDNLVIHTAGKVEKTRIDIFHLHADRIDLGNALANSLQVGIHLGALPTHICDIHPHASGQVDAPAQFGKLRLYLLRITLTFDRSLQQLLQQRK